MSVPMRWQQPIEPQEANRTVSLPQRRRSTRRTRRTRTTGAMFVLLTVCASAAIGLRFTGVRPTLQSGLQLMQTPNKAAQVALSGISVERNLGFVTVTGNVRNQRTRSLAHVEAVVELVDAQNRTVGVESALIGQDSLPGGAIAPFRVEMEDNSGAVGYRVHFRKLLGTSLD